MNTVNPVRSVTVSRCHRLVKEGDVAGVEMYYVTKGCLLVIKGDVLISRIDAPSFAGEIGPILGRPRSTTLMAKTDCSLDVYDVREFLSKLTIESDQGYKFLKILIARFEATKERVDEFQRAIVEEYVKILAEMVTSKKVAEGSIQDQQIKSIHQENEERFQALLSHKKAIEDCQVIHNLARQYGVEAKFKTRIASRFRSFAPMDIDTFKTPKLAAYLSFKDACAGISEEIVVLTRYLTDLQSMNIDRFEQELPVIEETLPFEERLKIIETLKAWAAQNPNPDGLMKKIADFEQQVQLATASPARDETPLAPLAKQFGLEYPYARHLRDMWKERLKKDY